MQIVIDIPDDFYERVNKDGCMSYTDAEVVVNAFYCGEERKTGKWISDYQFHKKVTLENGQVSCSCWCSECGDWLTASDEYPCRGYYCPNCGAKMEVGDVRD